MIKKQLVMVFLDEMELEYTIRIQDPKDDLNRVDVRTAGDTIVDANIFSHKGNDLVEIKSAYVREVIVNDII